MEEVEDLRVFGGRGHVGEEAFGLREAYEGQTVCVHGLLVAQGVVEFPLCCALGSLGFAEAVTAQRLFGAGCTKEVRQGVLEGLGHAGFGLAVEQGRLGGDLVLVLEAEQGRLADGDVEGAAGRAGGRLEVEVLDPEAGAEFAAQDRDVGIVDEFVGPGDVEGGVAGADEGVLGGGSGGAGPGQDHA
ncbi:hypothetical protein AB0O07_06940 [Streptomyces sp. NPDC093085]|uniref:hypothetical protein n=1 Tax=Streptomyces sp. NPDC093085 TaxID=3155068 RepID=UPI003417B992